MSARPVYLHIGLQKTGTSYLQAVFWAAQDELRRQGLDLVPPSKRETFHLMLQVRERYDEKLDPPEVAIALDRLPGQLEAATGDRALVTEESLASATPAQIRRLLDACAGREVHLVVTVRDLARLVPSMWQQQLRSGGTVAFDDYLDGVVRRQGPGARRFWRNQGLVKVLERWGAHVPAERIHLVTVPPTGSAPTVLLERYCSVLGVDPAPLASSAPRGNPALGRVEAELLRRVNVALPGERRVRQLYGDVGKRYFSQRVLGQRRDDRIRLPHRLEPWCHDEAERIVKKVAGRGYDVVGDLQDLVPRPGSFEPDGRRVAEADVADAAVTAIATMLDHRMTRLKRRRRAQRRRARRPRPVLLVRVRRQALDRLRRRG